MNWKIVALLVIVGSVGFISCKRVSRPGWNTALALDIQGKHQPDKCEPFAKDLYARLKAARVEVYYVSYHWRARDERGIPFEGDHAFIVYKEDGFWSMDNELEHPVLVSRDDEKDPVLWAIRHSRVANRAADMVELTNFY